MIQTGGQIYRIVAKIGISLEGTIPELSELTLDIMALMELVDVLGKEKHYVK